jgi:cyanophycin synthetase
MESQGYRFGMRQPASRTKFNLHLPNAIDFKLLDQWILNALEFDAKHYQLSFFGIKATGKPVEKYLSRWLCVTTILLQDIRVPVFERAAITYLTHVQNSPQHFVVELWLPVVQHFPVKVFHAWLSIAHELISEVLKHADDQYKIESIYQAFQQKHVLPWSAQIPGGKSTIPILQAAFEAEIPFAHCGFGFYVLGWGASSRIFDRSSNILDSAIGSKTTQYKHMALQWMQSSGIPVPHGSVFNSGQSLTLASVSHLRLPLVVKPVDRDRGEGVSLGVNTEATLQSAIRLATAHSKQFLVEEQIAGTCHRILVIDGDVVYAVKRNPKSVVGDGLQTIAALVNQLNMSIRRKIPNKRLPEYPLDELALECLRASGLSPNSVLAPGEKAFLRPAQSTLWGGDPEDVTSMLHPENAALAIKAARLFGLNCAGVDFISTDIARPWHHNGAVINEVNRAPVMGRTHPFQKRAARAYMRSIFPSKGRIPIDVFIGSGYRSNAEHLWQKQVSSGIRSVFCTEEALHTQDGKLLHLAGPYSAYEKIAMLRADSSIDGLVVHADSLDLIAASGLPFEYASMHYSGDAKT